MPMSKLGRWVRFARPVPISVLVRRMASAPVLVLLLAASSSAQDWPRFRGPNGSGVQPVEGLPVELDTDRSLRWRCEVPFGRSSPVLGEGTVYLTAAEEESLVTVCLDRSSGATRWTRRLPRPRKDARFKDNDAASPTPATDGDNVYVFFPELGLVALDRNGTVRWTAPLGPFRSFYGMASSPVLAGDAVLLQCDQEQGSFLLCVDGANGQERWRRARPEAIESWTTPVLFPTAELATQVIAFGSYRADGYSVESGQPRWNVTGLGATPVSSPVLSGARLFVCAPDHSPRPLPEFEAWDHDGDGRLVPEEFEEVSLREHFGWADRDDDDVIDRQEWDAARAAMSCADDGLVAIDLAPSAGGAPEQLWRYRRNVPIVATPLAYQGLLFLVRDGGLLVVLDAASGRVRGRVRVGDPGDRFVASPVAGDHRVYLASEAGRLLVLDATPEAAVLGSRDLDEEIFATPALGADGTLFVRTARALYCFAKSTDD